MLWFISIWEDLMAVELELLVSFTWTVLSLISNLHNYSLSSAPFAFSLALTCPGMLPRMLWTQHIIIFCYSTTVLLYGSPFMLWPALALPSSFQTKPLCQKWVWTGIHRTIYHTELKICCFIQPLAFYEMNLGLLSWQNMSSCSFLPQYAMFGWNSLPKNGTHRLWYIHALVIVAKLALA
jgi:hypothetical protein